MNEIINVRIDDRLIHGQVATFWTNTLSVNRIMVVDDEVAVDEVTKSVLRMAAPSNVNTSIISINQAAQNLMAGKYKSQRLLLVVKSPITLLNLIKLGVKIDQICVGNMSKRDNTQHIEKSISVTEDEYQTFKELQKLGIEIYSQMVPSDNKTEFSEVLKEYRS